LHLTTPRKTSLLAAPPPGSGQTVTVGPVTEDEHTAALDELKDLDVEHERRRAAGKSGAGEAA
jgi:hypothetical protein